MRPTKKREKTIYRETYTRDAAVVRADLLPATLPCIKEGWRVASMVVLAAGTVQWDDEMLEYIEFRAYVKPPDGDGRRR